MTQLANGLSAANHHEEALAVMEADLSTEQRLGVSGERLLVLKSNLASIYDALGREHDALLITRDVYSGCLKLKGEEDIDTLTEAHNYAATLGELKRFEEAKALLGKVMPVRRRILGDCHELTLKMRWNYANAVREDDCATRDELREANDTLEDTARIARRVLGPSHPNVVGENSIHRSLELVQAKLALLDGY